MGRTTQVLPFLHLGVWFPDKEEIELERIVFRYTCSDYPNPDKKTIFANNINIGSHESRR